MTSPELPPVSLVICTRNRPQLLAETIESVLEAGHLPDEIVVVDQSDDADRSIERAGGPGETAVRVIAALPKGLGHARNVGAAAARNEILVFIDDDMWAARGWLDTLIRGLVSAQPGTVVTGAVQATAAESPGGFTPSTQSHASGAVFAGRLDKDVLAGGHMAIERSTLEAVGGFDPRLGAGAPFPAADDNDLGFRLLEAGFRIVYVGDSVLYHRAWRPGWRYPVVRWRYGKGKGGFYAKHRDASGRHMRNRAAHDVGHRLRRLPRLALRQPMRATGDVFYIAGILAGGSRWLVTERRR